MKKIIFFVIMLSLVSRGSVAQTNVLGIKYFATPSQTGIPFLTGNGGSRVAVGGTDFVLPSQSISGDVTGGFGSTVVGKILGRTISTTAPTNGQVYQWNGTNWIPITLAKTDVGLGNIDNTSDVNKPVSTAQATAIALKANSTHTHTESDVTNLTTDLAGKQPIDGDLTSLAAATGTNTLYYRSASNTFSPVTIGSNLSFASGTLDAVSGGSLPSQTGNSGKFLTTNGTSASWGTPSGSGGTVVHPYANTSYASTINLDFDATNYPNITGVTGDLTFTASNNSNGKVFVVAVKKTATTPINIYFNNTNFVNPRLRSYTTLATADNTTTPYKFTLTAPAGEFTLAFEQRIDGPRIIIDNDANIDNAVPQKANIINLKNYAAFVDPGTTTAETVLFAFTIPAGTLSDSSALIFNYVYRRGASGTCQVKIRACASSGQTLSTCPTIEDIGLSLQGDIQRTAVMINSNLSSQYVQPGYVYTGNLSAGISKSIDFNNPVFIKATAEKQTSTSQSCAVGMLRVNVEGK